MSGHVSELLACGVLPDALRSISAVSGVDEVHAEALYYFMYTGRLRTTAERFSLRRVRRSSWRSPKPF